MNRLARITEAEHWRSGWHLGSATMVIGILALAAPAAADSSLPTVQARTGHIVEWDLPAQADASPGAMVVDTMGHDKNRLWFVTRLGTTGNPRVYRLDAAKSLMKGNAQWQSWELADDTITTGGLRKIRASWDRRYVFVRTASSIQRIDTQDCDSVTCARTEWQDQVGSLNVSDLSIDDQNHVFTTGSTDGDPFTPVPPSHPEDSYVQMLTPGTGAITRWTVGGGAGFCAPLDSTTTSFPCLSGIAVLPGNRNLVYFSEPQGQDGIGNISELNISTNTVRRWPLAALTPPDMQGGAVRQPRQLTIDRWGIVWVVTGSGHLVSLDPCRNQMRVHTIPTAMLSDPFGLAPDDDVVGYTDAGNNKIGMVFPKGPQQCVNPATTCNVPRACTTQAAVCERANHTSGAICPTGKVVDVTVTKKTDGTFVEAQLDSHDNDDLSPLGITANKGKGQGTFFYAIGAAAMHPTADRVGFVRLPMAEKSRHARDDDDFEDGWDHQSHPNGWHESDADDDDDDGFENEYDSPTAQENVQVIDDAPAIPGGQFVDYTVTTTSTSLALIATSTASDPLAQIGIDVYNPLGLLAATSAPTPGLAVAPVTLPTAGNYKVRIRNYGVLPITPTPKLIVREPWLP